MRPRPPLRERAALSFGNEGWVRANFQSPHPPLFAEIFATPSPARAGEGAAISAVLAAHFPCALRLRYALRFTSARNAFTGFALAGTRFKNASSSGAVL